MAEDTSNEPNITSRTGVRVSISAIAGMVIGIGVFLYSEIERVHSDTERKFEAITLVIDGKADKPSTADRYTATDAERDIQHVEQRDQLRFEAIYRELDRIQSDIRQDHSHKSGARWGTPQSKVQ